MPGHGHHGHGGHGHGGHGHGGHGRRGGHGHGRRLGHGHGGGHKVAWKPRRPHRVVHHTAVVHHNTGYGHSGYGHSGYGHSGYGHSGYGHSGYGHSGYGHSGYGHSGYGHQVVQPQMVMGQQPQQPVPQQPVPQQPVHDHAAEQAAAQAAAAAAEQAAAEAAEYAAAEAAEAKYMAELAAPDANKECKLVEDAKEQAAEVAQQLRAAMKGFGTNEKKMIKALADKNNHVLVETVRSYNEQFGRDLFSDIKSECSGNFESSCLDLLRPQNMLDAKNLMAAMEGIGTNEDRLDEVILFRTGFQLRGVQMTFMQQYEKELTEWIEDECSGHGELLYLCALTEREARGEDDLAGDVQALYDAGEGQIGTDEETFARILGASEASHVAAMNALYAQNHGKDLTTVIKDEFGGVFDSSDLKRCLLNIAMGYGNFLGKRLHKAMKGMGTDDKMLRRLIFSHRESNMLPEANAYLLQETGKSLITWIKNECSGDYERLLVAVCQAWGCTA